MDDPTIIIMAIVAGLYLIAFALDRKATKGDD